MRDDPLYDYLPDWRGPDGESLWDVVRQHIAAKEAEERRLVARLAEFNAQDPHDPTRYIARFYARYPHYAPGRHCRGFGDCFETLADSYRFADWLVREGTWSAERAAWTKEQLAILAGLDFGGPQLPKTYN